MTAQQSLSGRANAHTLTPGVSPLRPRGPPDLSEACRHCQSCCCSSAHHWQGGGSRRVGLGFVIRLSSAALGNLCCGRWNQQVRAAHSRSELASSTNLSLDPVRLAALGLSDVECDGPSPAYPPLPPGVSAGGHGGSHPHLVNEFANALIEDRDPWPNAVTSANWTCVGICAHESAEKGGEKVALPDFTLG